jgi:hypothetical protein
MAMCKLGRVTVAALCGAALILAHLSTPAYAASSSSVSVHAAGAEWEYYGTYPSYASCAAAGETQGRNWQCVDSHQAGAYDLYLRF